MAKRGVLVYPGFMRLWLAGTVSRLGTFTFGLALQLLLIETLDADQAKCARGLGGRSVGAGEFEVADSRDSG